MSKPNKQLPLPPVTKITFGNDELDIEAIVSHEYGDVAEASVTLPWAIEVVNQWLQYYTEQVVLDEYMIKFQEATAYFELRNGTFIGKYGDKMTEKSLEHAVALDERVTKAHQDYASTKGWLKRLDNAVKTFQAKLDLVRTTEATRRHVDTSVSAPDR